MQLLLLVQVIRIVLQDSLHQPQYVKKLEKIIRFVIKKKALCLQDLDDIRAAQVLDGRHWTRARMI